MDPERAMTIARRLHAGHREEGGTPVLRHIGRVARASPPEARTVAWLHEALESGVVTERQLLAEGLRDDELRALRLLARITDSRLVASVRACDRAANQIPNRSSDRERCHTWSAGGEPAQAGRLISCTLDAV
jgi:hypothetical protein